MDVSVAYIAPVLGFVGMVLIVVLAMMCNGQRNSARPSRRDQRATDLENLAPQNRPRAITQQEIDQRFPLAKYSALKRQRAAPPCDHQGRSSSPTPSSTSSTGTPKQQQQDGDALCAICMEVFDDDDDARALTCAHIFHSNCVDPWLIKRQACCPLCKMAFSDAMVRSPDELLHSTPALPQPAVTRGGASEVPNDGVIRYAHHILP